MTKPRVMLVMLILTFAALACNLPGSGTRVVVTGTPGDTGAILTQVALTVNAELTPASPGGLSSTPTATWIPAPTTPVPGATQGSQETSAAQKCDEASFISDVTIPDGTKINPGETFVKTWRLKNIGTCTWTSGYSVVFVSGDSMGAPAVVNFTGSVPPNATIDISIEMRAPTQTGKYTGYWKLRNAEGGVFGPSGDLPFFVQIEVAQTTPTVTITPTITLTRAVTLTPTATTAASSGVIYSFAAHLCEAVWRSQTSTLTCQGSQSDANGAALLLQNPQLESGTTESNPVIFTSPNQANDGAITGQFPAITIQAGDRFQAALSCLYGASQCAVIYQLNYILGDAPAASLGQWPHSYSGAVQGVDVDLSPLAGQQVQLVLAVLSSGSPAGDQAVWVYPRIVRK